MNHTPPEPQDITTALLSLDIISEVYRRQLEWRDIYAKDLKRGEVIMIEDMIAEHGIFYWITIIAPFKITDFSSLNKCIIDKGTIQPEIRNTIKRILAVAKENIHLFETMESIPVDKLILAYFNVDSQNNVTRLLGKLATEASNNPYKQVFNNYQLDEYCNEVADFMSSCLAPDQQKTTQVKVRDHPEKWYALFHMILMAIGKELPRLVSGGKREIINYGREQYGTNQGFYQELKKIDLNNMTAYVRSLPLKDRKQWKNIITKISGNNADVISWLNKQPN
jgi:hypothetical protein